MNHISRHASAVVTTLVVASLALTTAAMAQEEPSAETTSLPSPADPLARGNFADQPGDGTALPPGAYVLTEVPPLSITFTVPNGWYKGNVPFAAWEEGSNSNIAFQSPDNVLADPCDPGLGMRDPAVGPMAADLAGALGSMRGLTATAPQDVTLAGYPGLLVDVTADPGAGCSELEIWDFAGFRVPGPGPGASYRLWILDVDGTRLVIAARTSADAAPDVTTELQAIVESIGIETAAS